VLLLATLGAAMLASNPWFTLIDDEWNIVDQAAQPVRETVRLFRSGEGQHEHPPLYDLLLHGWLQLTRGEMGLLRVPSVLFFLLALWVLSQAARGMSGVRSAQAAIWLGVLWPYGFHFGRLATWYSFSFLLVALVTLAYLKFVERPTRAGWARLTLAGLALVYASYFGWALLACLAVDFAVRHRSELAKWWRALAGTSLLLLLAYLPLLLPFLGEIKEGIRPGRSAVATVFSGAYDLYCLFVSESVAPWVWTLSLPALLAIAACLLIALLRCPEPAKRFLVFFLFLLAAMTLLGIANARRLLLIGGWLLLPIASTLGSLEDKALRRALVVSLAVIAGIGWYGTMTRRFYAAPRWIEPWPELARQAAGFVRAGGVVIGNNASLFFYLTYLLRPEHPEMGSRFTGLLPASVRYPGVYDPEQWIDARHPTGSTILFFNGLHYVTPTEPTEMAQSWLDVHCQVATVRHLIRDPGANVKQKFSPETNQPFWRIEIRAYACPESRSSASEPRAAPASERRSRESARQDQPTESAINRIGMRRNMAGKSSEGGTDVA
jgi:hypothetical protein